MSQGYITLATGPRAYIEMAVNLLLSLRVNDPHRPTCIVIDEGAEFPPEFRPYVDHVVHLAPKAGYHGCLNKLRLHELSPFDESMFVDSDCLLVKNDMDRHWRKFAAPGFSIAGGKVTSGQWYGFDIAQVLKQLGAPYMVKMNSGVFYFRKGPETQTFFDTTARLVETHPRLLGSYHRNRLQLADEPFIGAAQGVLGITPLSYQPEEGSIMITTVASSRARFNVLARESSILKHDGFRLFNRFLPARKVLHSPSFAHFVKLLPADVYRHNAQQLRAHHQLPPFPP